MADRNYGVYNVWIGAPIERTEKPIGVSAFGLDYPGGPANISSLGQDITVYWDIFGPFGYGYGRQPWGTTPWGGSFPEIFLGVLVEVYMPTLRGQKTLVRRVSLGPRAMNYTYREDENRHDAAKLGHTDFQPVIEVAVGMLTTAGKGGTWEAGASARVTTINGGPIPPPPRHSHTLDELNGIVLTDLEDGDALVWDEDTGKWINAPVSGGGGGTTDHGLLTGLDDDDHPQYIFSAPIASVRNEIQPGSGSIVPFTITGAASQSADLQDWKSSGGTVLAKVTSAGKIFAVGLDAGSQLVTNVLTPASPTDAATKGYVDALPVGVTEHSALDGLAGDDHTQYVIRTPGSDARNTVQSTLGVVPFIVKAHASQTVDLQTWQSSAAAVLAKVTSAGKFFAVGMDAGSQKIENLALCTVTTDAANKSYVDSQDTVTAGLAVLRAPGTSAVNVVQPTGAAVIPLTIKGAVSQTANLIEVQNSGATVIARVTPAGKFFALGLDAGSQKVENVALCTVTTDGANKSYVDSQDTITAGLCVLKGPGTSLTNIVQPTGATIIPLTIRGFASQTGNLVEFQSSAAAILARVSSAGKIFGTGMDAGSQLITNVLTPAAGTDAANRTYVLTSIGAHIGADDHDQYVFKSPDTPVRNIIQPTTDIVALTVKAVGGGSEDLQQWSDPSVGVMAGVTANGQVYGSGLNSMGSKVTSVATPTVGSDAANKTYVDGAVGSPTGAVILAPATTARNTVQTSNAAATPLSLKGAVSQSADMQLWQSSTNSILARMTAAGKFIATGLDASSQLVSNVLTPSTGTDAANKDYVDTKVAAVGAVITAPFSSTRNEIMPTGDFVPLSIRGAASQTLDLQTWRLNLGTTVAKITNAGKVFGTGFDAGSQLITNVLTPSATTDAANRAYVDSGDATAPLLAPATTARNTIQPTAATIIPLTIKGFASQSVDLQNWQNSAAGVLAKVTSVGKVFGVGLDAGSQLVTNVLTPSAGTDAVNKSYADLLPAANGVSNLQLRDSVALSLIGRAGNSGGDPGDIATTALSNAVMRESGSGIGWGLLTTANLNAAAGLTRGQLASGAARTLIGVAGNAAAVPADIPATASSNTVMRESGGTIGWGLLASANLATNAGITRAQLVDAAGCSVAGRPINLLGPLVDIVATSDGQIFARKGGVVAFYTPSLRTIHTRFFDVPSMWGETVAGTPTLVQTNPTTFNATSGASHFAGLLMGDTKITWIRFAFVVPEDHQPNTGFTVRICFVLNSAGSGAVDLAILGGIFNDNDFSASAGTFFGGLTKSVVGWGASDYIIVDMTPVAIGLVPGQYVQGVIQRDARVANAADTYPDLIGVAWVSIKGSPLFIASTDDVKDDTDDDT